MIQTKYSRFTALKAAFAVLIASIMLFAGMALGQVAQQAYADTPSKYLAEIKIKDKGTVIVELDRNAAPITVDNFVKLSKSGFYNNRNIPFHRVESNFVIQGGDPKGDGSGGSEQTIKGEFSANKEAFPPSGWNNPISHKRGVISMARSGDTKSGFDTASSQFFIVLADGSYGYEFNDNKLEYVFHSNAEKLDGQYAAFGHVVTGMPIIDDIVANTKKDSSGKVTNPAIIESINITPYFSSGGWRQSGGSWWYEYDAEAKAYYQNQPYYAKNVLLPINGKLYCFDNNGWMATGWQQVNGTWYYFDASGAPHSGWLLSGNAWYLMNEDGVMQTGWASVNGETYYLQSSGAMKTGWHQDGDDWYYLATYDEKDSKGNVITPMGAAKTNTITYFGNSAYMFDSTGKMAKGLQSAYIGLDDNDQECYYTFYFGSSGAHQTGWIKDKDKWYFFHPDNGIAVKGWNFIGAWYLMDNKGAMLTGWQKSGDRWYYLGGADDGTMKTGWINDGKGWYFLWGGGDMAANTWIGNYYVGSDGKMLTNTTTPDGFHVGADGAWDGKPAEK